MAFYAPTEATVLLRPQGWGGAIQSTEIEISASNFVNNTAMARLCFLLLLIATDSHSHWSTTLTSSTDHPFSRLFPQSGGALSAVGGGIVRVRDSVFIGNEASVSGGAVHLAQSVTVRLASPLTG